MCESLTLRNLVVDRYIVALLMAETLYLVVDGPNAVHSTGNPACYNSMPISLSISL